MSHHHDHHHHGTENISVAFFLNLVFTIIEVVGGLMTNSLAILSDALHDLGDSLSLGLAWYFQKISGRSRDHQFSYGYRRFSLMGAVVNSIVLIVGSIFIIKAAVPRLIHPEEANPKGMMILAVIGIVINGAAVLRLKRGTSHNERVVSLHLMEDVLGWAAVLIGGAVIYFTGYYIIDPILSLGIAVYILFNIYRNLKESMSIILQAVPSGLDIQNVEAELESVPDVLSIHDLHIWSLDGERNILTVHVVISGGRDRHFPVKKEISDRMARIGITHCTIETELEGEECVLHDC